MLEPGTFAAWYKNTQFKFMYHMFATAAFVLPPSKATEYVVWGFG
jgi:hypothetical protein